MDKTKYSQSKSKKIRRITLFLFKPDALYRDIVDKGILLLELSDYEIILRSKYNLTRTNIFNLYKETIQTHFSSLDKANAFEQFCKYLQSGQVELVIVRHRKIKDDFIFEHSTNLRGQNWIPAKCRQNTIRYQLREIKDDNIVLSFSDDGSVIGKYPANICHTPSSYSELARILYEFSLFSLIKTCQ